ncbi:leucine-rich repeat-containing protein 74B-like isoform X2 [Mercenaria mercenaria]|uniref:leucine-rich repeat-containing protein 74B-like isoform X2 n=1 Tax=Mercenaria mercenaria TaxID=6596 RepID=UPI00234F7D44|nr:leucine-rich repeat-containing protein 74B-like isoform X2 [Mercenaria mercenaria]
MDKLTSRTVFHDIETQPTILEEDDDNYLVEDRISSTPASGERKSKMSPTPRIDSDEEWDTDLETEGNEVKRHYISEDQVKQVYLAACRQLNIVPAHCFLKAINTDVMNLNFQGLGSLGTRAVATALVIDRFTTRLNLAGNLMGHEGIRNLCDMLKENDFITHLDLSENGLDSYAAEVISGVFKVNDTLTDLILSGNHFKDYDAEHFAAMLNVGQFTGLRNLDLSHNDLGDIGAQILGHAIGDNETLTHISLAWNQIRKAGISCIAKGIGENNSLLVFDLTSNGVDNEAAELIGKALVNNRKLTELNLTSNRVGFVGIASLFKYIGKNDTLKVIRLTNNPITSQGPAAALKLLQQSDCSVLQELEIADACVPREFYSVLEEVQHVRPQFKVQLGGFMNARDMCKAEAKSQTEAWKRDPILVFINFIDDRKIKVFDMFKLFDKDKSCTLTRDEFKIGLSKIGCPLAEQELNQLLNVLDVDKDGEIDLGEFMDGFDKHKRRLTKYSKYGTTSRVASPTSRANSGPSSTVSSRPSSSSSDGRAQHASRPSSGVHADVINSKNITTETITHTLTLEPPGQSYALHASYNDQAPDNNDIVLTVPKGLTVT